MSETSIDHYLRVRDFFVKRDFPALLSYPFSRNFPLIQALRYWACFLEQKSHPPLDLSVRNDLPVGFQCQLALIWAAIAKETGDMQPQRAANQLAGMIAPLVLKKMVTFGSREREFLAEETDCSVDLFLQAIGTKSIRKNRDNFFVELQEMDLQIVPEECPLFPYQMLEGKQAAMACTLHGSRVSLGAAYLGSLQILAFGLQGEPCTQQSLFGVDLQANGYVKVSALPKVWVHVEPQQLGDQEFSLSLQAVGLEAEKPLHLAFYIRSASCQINNLIYKPKSLGRFQGVAQKIQFLEEGSFQTAHPGFIELIPLAGEGPFWGASFLLAFRFPLSGQIRLNIKK